jgi:hypothetical protein
VGIDVGRGLLCFLFRLDAIAAVVVILFTTGGDICLEFESGFDTSCSFRNEAASFRIKGLLDVSDLELAVVTDSESALTQAALLTLDVLELFILC